MMNSNLSKTNFCDNYSKSSYEKGKWKSVYVMLSDDGNVKIGVSSNISNRISQIELCKHIIKTFSTEMCSNAYSIESKVHEILQEHKTHGEWFNVEFDIAVNIVKNIFSSNAKYKIESYEKYVSNQNKLFEQIIMNKHNEDEIEQWQIDKLKRYYGESYPKTYEEVLIELSKIMKRNSLLFEKFAEKHCFVNQRRICRL